MTTTPTPTKALEILQNGIAGIQNSEQFKTALAFRRTFHTYSINNALLIAIQKPEATLVAGYKAWQQKGRQVRKGEKGIAILAPLMRKFKDDNGDEEVRPVGFRTTYVFDVSQTDGEAIPELPQPAPTGAGATQELFDALTADVTARGITVEREDDLGGAWGYYQPKADRIVLRSDLGTAEATPVLIHELAHALLHKDTDKPRHVAELEAEATAFLIAQELGVDTAAFSFSYIAGWNTDGTPEQLTAALTVADRAAREYLENFTA